jgi:tripartite ATP-independent transporter DctM subunit
MLLTLLVVLLFLLIFLGMEISWAIAVSCLGYLFAAEMMDVGQPLVLIPQTFLVGIDSFALLAVPLFIFAGELMTETGVTRRLIQFAATLVGHIRGGLANVGVVTNFVMAGISGSAIADAAAIGTVLIPQMTERRYPIRFSCAVIAASSTVGPIIPPSISFVLLGAIVNLSVGRLFLGGVIPGTLMSVAMFALTYWISRRRGYPIEARATWGECLAAFLTAVLPLAAPLIVVSAMTFGVATPTEAAAILVVYVMVLGLFVYRSLTWRSLLRCASNAALVSAIVMITVGAAQIFSVLAVYEQFGDILTSAMLAVSSNVYVLLLMFNVILLVLGVFMEPLPLMLVMAPIVFPMFEQMGIDPIHLGVVMVINIILGLITPPVGLVLSVVGVIGRIDPMDMFWDVLPYKIALILVLLLLTYWPALTLFLPNLVMGHPL